MGGHGGLNILPQKRWNVYNFDNREKVRQDEEAAAKEEQLKRDAEFRLQKLRLARGIHSSDQSSSTTTTLASSSSASTDSNHINLFEGLKNFHSLEAKPQQQEADQTDDKGSKRKKLKKEEAPKVVSAEDEKYRLGYGIAGKGVKAPWYMSKPSLSAYNNHDEKEESNNTTSEKKKSGKKTVEELREERLKREKHEKEREFALVREKTRPRNVTSFQESKRSSGYHL